MLVAGEDTDGSGADWLYDDEFFSAEDLELMDYEIKELRKHIEPVDISYDYGVFPGQLMSNHVVAEGAFRWWLGDKLKQSGYINQEFIVGGCNIVTLHKPFDVHTDYLYRYFWGGDTWLPFMNFIIPLTDTSSRTVVFDQYSDKDTYHFHLYKEDHEYLENPVSEEWWNEHCSHCWPEDRNYLTVKHTMPAQKRGMLTGIKSKFYHCSDHFHLNEPEPKGFIHLRIGVRR
jgi:hypothetical protein